MPPPQLGQRFPALTLETTGSRRVTIPHDFAGTNVVLSWFPYAFSPVCDEELSTFARVHRDFERLHATVVAASCDHWYSNEAYKTSLKAPYPFVSDWYRTEARKLGIFDEPKQRSGRAIYVLDKQGMLRWMKEYPTSVCPSADEFLPTLQKLA
jgi:alkyl hydroperoxide reductase subunit AhpC